MDISKSGSFRMKERRRQEILWKSSKYKKENE